MKIPYKCTNYLAVVEKTVRKKRKIFLTFVCRYSRIHKTKKHQSDYKSCLNSPTIYFRSRLRNISPIVFPSNGKRLSPPAAVSSYLSGESVSTRPSSPGYTTTSRKIMK